MSSNYEIEVANLQEKVKIDEEIIYKVVSFVLSEEDIDEAEVSVALVEIDEILKLNEEYRKVSQPTDVLSFLYDLIPYMSGEIVICPEYVKQQALDSGTSFLEEFVMLLIHGTLHLLGYEHEANNKDAELMWKRQKELVEKFFQQHNIS